MRRLSGGMLAIGLVAGALAVPGWSNEDPPADQVTTEAEKPASDAKSNKNIEARPIAPFVNKALGWLVEAQHTDGGWGGGSHAAQQIRDPHAVKTDPATTAFATMALMRSGHTPTQGDFKEVVRRATLYLVEAVEKAEDKGPRITDIQGTQPQVKLGQMVDTTMTAQCLARLSAALPKKHELRPRVDKALAKCVRKLEASQNEDGGWNFGGGWAPVLQSSAGQQALELAEAAGQQVDRKRLDKAREYHKKNFDPQSGKIDASRGAGVELYAFSSAQRANASEARAASEIVEEAKAQGKVAADAPVDADSLTRAGISAPQAEKLASAAEQNRKQIERLDDGQLLRGFGNNGGEEFVSFLMTSESMILAGGEQWNKWDDKMHDVLAKVQNPDGSWNGHHCITSPVFCTAAVVQCLTADRDAELLIAIAKKTADNEATKTARSGKPGKQ
ncbi:MAG: terpene cyclase/mutase family protein [Planctomycetales bacterium]|nr:terpene cyclase/mutase family protein [Planctomycetales bacterium]